MPCLLCRLWHRDIQGVAGIWVEKVETVDVMCGRLSLMAVCVAYSCKAVEGLALASIMDATDGGKRSVIERCERTGDGVLTSIPCGRLPWGTVGLSFSSLRSHTPYLLDPPQFTYTGVEKACVHVTSEFLSMHHRMESPCRTIVSLSVVSIVSPLVFQDAGPGVGRPMASQRPWPSFES